MTAELESAGEGLPRRLPQSWMVQRVVDAFAWCRCSSRLSGPSDAEKDGTIPEPIVILLLNTGLGRRQAGYAHL